MKMKIQLKVLYWKIFVEFLKEFYTLKKDFYLNNLYIFLILYCYKFICFLSNYNVIKYLNFQYYKLKLSITIKHLNFFK